MTSSANKKALELAIDEQQKAAFAARKAVVETLNDVQATLRLLKMKLGISPAQIAIANIGKGEAAPKVTAPSGSRGHSALETKRIEAGQLMTKMGYRIDYSNEKSGLVRIVGPNFSADFYDIADFDGTANGSVSH